MSELQNSRIVSKEAIRARYGKNKPITGSYDESVAVKCINGTFVGKKDGDIVYFKGIPFVAEQPTGKNRFKKPVPYKADDGVYEAFNFAKGSLQPETPDDAGSLAVLNNPQDTFFSGRAYDDTFNHTIQRMWVNFAMTGDPSLSKEESPTGEAIPWEQYNSDTKPLMVFDEFNVHPDVEGNQGIVDWERTYPLTKYYIF